MDATAVDEAAAADLDRNPETEHFVRNLAFAKWTPEMFPTLSRLHDELHASSLQKGPEQEMRATLASLLTPWLRDGLHGALVDGPNNIDLGTVELRPGDPLKVVHFELEKVSAHDVELRAVAGFLILNQVRNHIQGMDRGIRKQLIIEEMLSFLKTPGGAQGAIDYYERMRKYSCQCISIFQQYSTLLEADPRVAKALVGNSSSLLLLRNHNRQDGYAEQLPCAAYTPSHPRSDQPVSEAGRPGTGRPLTQGLCSSRWTVTRRDTWSAEITSRKRSN